MEPLYIMPEFDTFTVFRDGEYEETSVLAGQYRREHLDNFRTLEAAQEAYPDAELVEYSRPLSPNVPDVAWNGFDEGDAGERWEED